MQTLGGDLLTLDKLKALFEHREFRYVHNKDCSEYAEDVVRFLGFGHIASYRALDKKPFKVKAFDKIDPTNWYHTIVIVDNYVIDVGNPVKVQPRAQYEAELMKLNSGRNFELLIDIIPNDMHCF